MTVPFGIDTLGFFSSPAFEEIESVTHRERRKERERESKKERKRERGRGMLYVYGLCAVPDMLAPAIIPVQPLNMTAKTLANVITVLVL